MNDNRSSRYPIVLFALLVCVAYGISLNAPFIFDDNHMIVENQFIKQPRFYPLFFTGHITSYPLPRGMARPLLMLTFACNFLASRLNPAGYHIINMLFHFINSVLLYLLLMDLFAGTKRARPPGSFNKNIKDNTLRGLAALVTSLFIVHPINTEAVTYISSRSDLMSTFFILAGFLLFLRKRYGTSALMYVFCLLTKETALCFPLLVFGHALLFAPRPDERSRGKRNLFLFSLLVISAAYFMYKYLFFLGIRTGQLRSPFSNILLQSWVSFFYLRQFIWPDNLNLLHAYPPILSLSVPELLFSFTGIIMLVVLATLLRKHSSIMSMGIFWFLVCLLPKFYATLKVPVMEHHFYLPSIGIYIIIVYLLSGTWIKRKTLVLYPVSGVLILLLLATVERNHQFNDPYRIWKLGTEKESRHVGNWLNLGIVYKDKSKLDKAQSIFRKALSLSTADKDWKTGIYVNMAGISFLQGHYKEAHDILQEGLALGPNPARVYQIYINMAMVYEKEKDSKQAQTYLNRALELNPYDEEVYQALAKMRIEANALKEAQHYLDKALELNPYDFYSYFLAGALAQKQGDSGKALEMYKQSITLNPDWYYSHWSLTKLYAKRKDPYFIEELRETIRCNPSFEPALNAARRLLSEKGNPAL